MSASATQGGYKNKVPKETYSKRWRTSLNSLQNYTIHGSVFRAASTDHAVLVWDWSKEVWLSSVVACVSVFRPYASSSVDLPAHWRKTSIKYLHDENENETKILSRQTNQIKVQ